MGWNSYRERAFSAPAKFAGVCAKCGASFDVGTMIFLNPNGSGGWSRMHEGECPDSPEKRAKEAEEKAKAERKAWIASLLDWPNREYGTKYQQAAWSDEREFRVQITVPDASDRDVCESLYSHNETSWGRLRWCTYRMDRREGEWLYVSESEHLCD